VVARALDKKLVRDLWRMRGQVLAIGLIMASGIGVLIMGLSTVESLDETARAYYERYRFAHVFARVTRAPERLIGQIAALPGVQTVETRVVENAVLDIVGFEEPVVAALVSLPSQNRAKLNLLTLRSGRMPRARSTYEALVSEPFAQAHGLHVGDQIRAILNGSWRELRIVGIALSPEYVYAIGPGALMPDDSRFGVLWLDEELLQAAFDLEGAFNDVSLALLRGANAQSVIDDLDRLLERYGSVGAYERADQISNWFLMNEIKQLRTLSRILPTIFLAVAAFLTNMVLTRLIAMERSEIGLLKAFGYSDREIGFHYFKFVLAIGVLGVLLGAAAGYWLGWYETRLYAEFYHFPFLLFRPGLTPFVIGAAIGIGAALAGAFRAVRRAAAMPPAEAMRPPSPPMFKRTSLSRNAIAERMEQLTRIILRQVARWPLRSFTTCFGISMAVAVLVVSMQWLDAIDHMVDVYFRQAQSQDVSVSFAEPRTFEAARALGRLPGVLAVEPMRFVPAKIRSGSSEQREALQGLPARQTLYRVYDARGEALTLPSEGLMVSSMLAKLLGVTRGDFITVEMLEGRRDTVQLRVAGTFETYIGSPAYMEINALARLMKERPTVTSVHLRVDTDHERALLLELKTLPGIAAITLKAAAIQMFDETMAETLLIFVSFFIFFSCALAFGVTYNAARIALSERGRELATLRVLGFTRAEISYLMLGEIGLLALLALPLGCLIGWLLANLTVNAFETELYRVPFVIEPSTYGIAILVATIATTLSALLVRRRIDRLDLIGVLKTRE
jgi:putative ABC transport system permease protein